MRCIIYLWSDWLYHVFRIYLRNEFYDIHIRASVVKIQEYNNKSTILQY
jgi:hypothetical protein